MSRSIPEELIKIKADQIGKKRERQGRVKTPEVDRVRARQYLEDHWWEVFCWKVNTLPGKLKLIVGLIIVAAFIICAYFFQWSWTGFVKETPIEVARDSKTETSPIEKFTKTTKYQSAKKLWDWLDLLIVPILIAVLGYQFQQRDKKKTADRQAELESERADRQAELERKRKQQADLEREIAKDNLAEEAIQAYLDRMSDLLLNKEFRQDLFPNVNDKLNLPGYDNPVRDVARTQTITILRRLKDDEQRQERIINFLRDAELYQFIFQNANLSKINLSQINLYKANLEHANLIGAHLEHANLREANLEYADLYGANLEHANLRGANLEHANLSAVNLKNANLRGAKLQEAHLYEAKLENANLSMAKLESAHLSDANLEKADLSDAKLKKADLIRVNLKNANLSNAELENADLHTAELENANLSMAKLESANLHTAKLKEADLYEANLEYADLYGANLEHANLRGANLEHANLSAVNLKNANLSAAQITKIQIKYEWNDEKEILEVIEPDNSDYIEEELKSDKASDPTKKPDCSIWKE